jgi:phosphoribosyl 1,2-cyclic phosphate phosphodiesterase
LEKLKGAIMRIKFLGTGASEAIPAMFCRCRICENARKVGGKEMRTRAGVLINDDLMVDFSTDAYWHARNYGLDFTKLKSIIITHGHSDHFNVEDLTNNRNHAVQAFEPDYVYLSPLKLYAEQKILDKMKKSCESNATVGSIVGH